jgi:hypothetical protein
MESEMKREKEAVQKLNKQVESRMKDRRLPAKRSGFAPNSREPSVYLAKRITRTKSGAGDVMSGALDLKIPDVKAVLGARGK